MVSGLRETGSWRALERHHADIGDVHLRELFAPTRGAASG